MTLSEVMFDAPLFGNKRSPKHDMDFGDFGTIGLNLKRVNKNFEEYGDYDFGVYLGLFDNKFHVGVMKVMTFKPSKLESFDTLEELKMEWKLD